MSRDAEKVNKAINKYTLLWTLALPIVSKVDVLINYRLMIVYLIVAFGNFKKQTAI